MLTKKAMRALEEYGAKSILLSGGVAANKPLRERLAKEGGKRNVKLIVADFEYNTDNAAMIGVAAYINFLRGKKYPLIARGDLDI